MDVREADLLLHVVDVSGARYAERISVVHSVLEGVLRDGAPGTNRTESIPTILVLNKIDLIDDRAVRESLLRAYPEAMPVSAARGEGLERLLSAIESRIEHDTVSAEVFVSTEDGKGIAAIESNARVLNRCVVDGRLRFDVSVRRRKIALLERIGEVRLRPLRPH